MKKYHKIQTVFKRDPDDMKILTSEYSLPEFEYLQDNKWIFTEKIDGTNIRIQFKDSKILFNGKTDNAQIPIGLLNELNSKFLSKHEKFKELFNCDVCLYGEGYGPKIQKGGKYKDVNDFVLFDISIGDWWLNRVDIEKIALELEIEVTPIIGSGTLRDMIIITKKGFNSQWGDFIAEGIVARPEIELKCRNGERIITKLKYRDFTK
jgi:hypothetical protein